MLYIRVGASWFLKILITRPAMADRVW